MRFLLLGDIVGKPGRRILADKLKKFRQKANIDFVIANAENSAGGSGVTENIARKLHKYGIDVLTHGDHANKKDHNKLPLEKYDWVIRPANFEDRLPGHGYVIVEHENVRIAVINLIGNIYLSGTMPTPFEMADKIINGIAKETDIIIVDIHAEVTSEKIALGWHLDGRVAAVVGTHTHIQTADERILPNGTAYITDLGMVGPYQSVIGRETDKVLSWFVKKVPAPFNIAKGDVQIRGAIIDVDPSSGKAVHIERVSLREDEIIE
ncbi:TIGR00282 family metallophosphoesterase [Planctomycetota bacterium]